MSPDDFKGLSPEAAIQKAGQETGIAPSVLDGVWATESGRGQSMRSGAGALGHFQIMPANITALSKQVGRQLDPNNFGDAIYMGATILKQNLDRYGNIADALKGYNGGNPTRWANKETAAYPGKVMDAAKSSKFSNPLLESLSDGESVVETQRDLPPLPASTAANGGLPSLSATQAKNGGLNVDIQANAAYPSALPPLSMTAQIPTAPVALPGGVSSKIATVPVALPNQKEYDMSSLASVAESSQQAISDSLQPKPPKQQKDISLPQSRGNEVSGAVVLDKGLDPFQPEAKYLNREYQQAVNNVAEESVTPGEQFWAAAQSNVSSVFVPKAVNFALQYLAPQYAQAPFESDPNFDAIATTKKLASNRSLSWDQQRDLEQTHSAAEFSNKLLELQDDEKNAQILGAGGKLAGSIAPLAAMALDPLTWVSGGVGEMLSGAKAIRMAQNTIRESGVVAEVAAARAARAATAEEGAKAAAAASAAGPTAEAVAAARAIMAGTSKAGILARESATGAIAGVAYTAGQEAVGQHVLLQDYFTQAGAGAALGLIAKGAAFSSKEGAKSVRETVNDWADIAKKNEAEKVAIVNEAKENLGPNATPDQIQAESERIITTKLEESMQRVIASVDDRLGSEGQPQIGSEAAQKLYQSKADAIKDAKEEAKAAGGTKEDIKAAAENAQPEYTREDFRAEMAKDPLYHEHQLENIADDAEAAQALDDLRKMKVVDDARPINSEGAAKATGKVFDWLQSLSSGAILSKNLAARVTGKLFSENPAGIFRGVNAIMRKETIRHKLIGDFNEAYDSALRSGLRALGKSENLAWFGSKDRVKFNDDVFKRQNGKREGQTPFDHPNPQYLKALDMAADATEQYFERERLATIYAKVTGYYLLPDNSKGYIRWRVSGEKMRNLNAEQTAAYKSGLSQEFERQELWNAQNLEGYKYTPGRSDGLATALYEIQLKKALGGESISGSRGQAEFYKELSDAIEKFGMTPEAKDEYLRGFKASTQSNTKGRLDRDLNRVFTDEKSGKTFTLGDIMDHDIPSLVGKEANRSAGQAALALMGVDGRAGADRILSLAKRGSNEVRATAKEIKQMESLFSHILGERVGEATPGWQRILTAFVRLQGLGGNVFAQAAETGQIVAHEMAHDIMKSTPELARFAREAAEAHKTGRGAGFLGDVEDYTGERFIAHTRNMNMPKDVVWGDYLDAPGDRKLVERLLQSGEDVQAKLSGFRLVQTIQKRAIAEATVRQAAKYIRDGAESGTKALRQGGFSEELVRSMKNDIGEGKAFQFDEKGNLSAFKPELAENPTKMNEFVESIYRLNKQIIQEVYPGETGLWAEKSFMRLLATFRTFGIVALEKQTIRQYNTLGPTRMAMGMLGSMSVTIPLRIGRAYAYASLLNRDDRKKFLDKQLDPRSIGLTALNYMGAASFIPDVFNVAASATGIHPGDTRQGFQTSFASSVHPVLGSIDNIAQATQTLIKKGDARKFVGSLPLINMPLIRPAANRIMSGN